LGNGVHARLLDWNAEAAGRLDFDFTLALQGTGRLDFTPIGRESQVGIEADWPHPSFVGNYLPVDRDVSSSGFSARWQTSFFSTNMQEAVLDCLVRSACDAFSRRQFGVNLIDPVDHYLQSERTIKYALLFIVLTFAAFFLFGVLRQLEVHPMQYGLIGLALALFYLLLLSLSEHIGFGPAYSVAATACLTLIGFYLCHVLQGMRRGLGFTLALAALYGVLFVIVSAEDYALLMGSILLFGLLATVMVLTRKLDWHSVGAGNAGSNSTAPAGG
jgi:inner membrane protein